MGTLQEELKKKVDRGKLYNRPGMSMTVFNEAAPTYAKDTRPSMKEALADDEAKKKNILGNQQISAGFATTEREGRLEKMYETLLQKAADAPYRSQGERFGKLAGIIGRDLEGMRSERTARLGQDGDDTSLADRISISRLGLATREHESKVGYRAGTLANQAKKFESDRTGAEDAVTEKRRLEMNKHIAAVMKKHGVADKERNLLNPFSWWSGVPNRAKKEIKALTKLYGFDLPDTEPRSKLDTAVKASGKGSYKWAQKKYGKMTPEEYEFIKTTPEWGEEVGE